VSTKKSIKPSFYETNQHISYPESKYITASAFDSNEKKADLLARKELINKISSTITAKSNSIKKAYVKNSELVGNSMIFNQMVKIESNFNHNELITIADRFYDNNKKHYSFAVLERNKYASVLESEMAVENEKFRMKYDLAMKMLNKLNIKEFKKIKKELIQDAFKYDTTLIHYSTALNDSTLFEKHNLSKNITELNNLYREKLNQNWYIYSVYNEIKDVHFKKLMKSNPNNRPWILRDNDEDRNNYTENKELTRVVYETIRDEKFKAHELSEYNYNAKKMINRSELDNIINKLDGKGKDKIVLTLSLIYKCSYDSAFYYCRAGSDVKAYNLENKEELFYFSVEGQTSSKTKVADINLSEAIKKSIQKLSPIIKERIVSYMKDYKDVE
jgi:hypothetical protein